MGEFIAEIHHVGSTAVPGLSARPIIDIAIESKVYPPTQAICEVLQSLGYISMFENENGFGFCFVKGHHEGFCLYWNTVGSKGIQQQLHFRDRLRSSQDMHRKYNNLKRSLAEKTHYEERIYHEHKIAIIDVMMQYGYGENNG